LRGVALPTDLVRHELLMTFAPTPRAAARSLGLQPSLGFNAPMIQTTSRLSRGARLRRGVPMWLYAGMALGGLAAALLFVLLRH
jgi:hypothetical protein